MRTKKIIIPIAIIVVVLIGVGLSIGLTYSLWSDTTGGDTSVAPSITTYDWNSYAKYFTYTAYNSSGNVIASGVKSGDTIPQRASYFSVTGLTLETLLPEIVFPQTVTYKVSSTTYTDAITEVGSTLFSDITYKAIPTRIVISPSITKVRQDAFAGLTNLQSVLICASSTTDTHGIRFGYHALGNCTDLKEIKCEGPVKKPNRLGIVWPRRFGILGVRLGDIEFTDPAENHELLAVDDETALPIVIRSKKGAGEVYFMNTWCYPSVADKDEGAGEYIGSDGLMTTVYKYVASISRGDVYPSAVGADLPDAECDYVICSYFPDDGRVFLKNIDFRKPHTVDVHVFGKSRTVVLKPAEMRIFKAQHH